MLRNEVAVTTTEILIGGAILIVLLLIGSWIVQSRQDRRDRAEEEAEAIALATPFDPMAGGFPVPPMPGQEFTFTSRRAMAQGTTIVQEPVTVAVRRVDRRHRGGPPCLRCHRSCAASGSRS